MRMRDVLATHKELAAKLVTLEQQSAALALKHDVRAHNTRTQFKQVMQALHELMTPPQPKRRPIGFVYPKEKRLS
jgi:hypothetical protein